MNPPKLHRIKITLHSWELPSWPLEHLRKATAGALRYALQSFYGQDVAVEVWYNAESTEGTVVDPLTGMRSPKGAQLELDIRGGTDRERHIMQHTIANQLEGIMRRVLHYFILHDAQNRYRQMAQGYKTYNDVDEPKEVGGILT